jgi:hypothetical protein
MNEMALLNIMGFRSAHLFDRKHYKHWGGDLQGIATDDQYLEVARGVGKEAAQGVAGTHVARRGNNNLIVYAATTYTRSYSNNCDGGLFMVVEDAAGRGLLITLFAPDEGVKYFHKPDQRFLI